MGGAGGVPETGKPVRVAVYFVDSAQRALAETALGESTTFANVVEGTAAPQQIAELVDAGLIVERLAAAGPPPEPEWDAGQAPAVEQLAGEALVGPLPEVAEGVAAAAAELPSDGFHRIELGGPLTQEQREAFEELGVDIAAFEPPSYYRTFLTTDQYDHVAALDGVVGITPYAFEDKLTKELVTLVEQEASDQPVLAADAERRRPPPAFDCLLHRERDLPRIQELIEGLSETEVIGTSNLRVRFTAPTDLSLLGALAALPEVRKLAVFQPPTSVGQGEGEDDHV